MLAQTIDCFLIGLFLIVQLAIFLFDGVKVNMCCEDQLILLVYVFSDFLKLLLKLLNIFFGMRVHFLKDCAGPFEGINLVRSPLSRSLFKLDLCLNYVELLFQLIKLPVVDL